MFTFVNVDSFIAACAPKTCVNGYFDEALCKCICPKENYGELCEGMYVCIANNVLVIIYCIADKEITGTQTSCLATEKVNKMCCKRREGIPNKLYIDGT